MSFPSEAEHAAPSARFSIKSRQPHQRPRDLGEWLSDRIAAIVGSWTFIVIQALLFACWVVLNFLGWTEHWDPYPFILLNLVLSFQAAFTGPVLMMAQNRQADIDRHKAQLDYDVNVRAETDIEALHEKIDLLREQDISRLIGLVETLTQDRIRQQAEAGR